MDAITAIKEAIEREYNCGATQLELAERAGLTKGHMSRLINGRSPIGSMSISALVRLFPQLDAAISAALLNAPPASGDNIQAGGAVISRSPGASVEAIAAAEAPVKLRMLESILKMALDNDVQLQILQNILELGDN